MEIYGSNLVLHESYYNAYYTYDVDGDTITITYIYIECTDSDYEDYIGEIDSSLSSNPTNVFTFSMDGDTIYINDYPYTRN